MTPYSLNYIYTHTHTHAHTHSDACKNPKLAIMQLTARLCANNFHSCSSLKIARFKATEGLHTHAHARARITARQKVTSTALPSLRC
jgi:hypothetical protein